MRRFAPLRLSPRQERRTAKRNARMVLAATPEQHKLHWEWEFKTAAYTLSQRPAAERPTTREYLDQVKRDAAESLPAVLAAQSIGITDYERMRALRAILEERERLVNRLDHWKSRGGNEAAKNDTARLGETDADLRRVVGGGPMSWFRAKTVISVYGKAKVKFEHPAYVNARETAHQEALLRLGDGRMNRRATDRAQVA